MGKKYTLEDVKEFAKSKEYKVLEEEYVNMKTYMKFKCIKCGEVVEKTFDNFKSSSNCANCKRIELNKKWDEILNRVLNICKKYNTIIPLSQMKFEGINVSSDNINDIIHRKGYKSYNDFCYKNNIGKRNIVIKGHSILVDNITIEDLKNLWEECKEKYKVTLGTELCNERAIDWNIPTWYNVQNILSKNNISLDDFYSYLGINCHIRDVSKYDLYLKEFVKISNELGEPIPFKKLTKNKWGLPSARWFIEKCPDKKIKNYNDFLEYAGFIPRQNVSKDKAIEVIKNMQSKLNRPLIYDDFRSPKMNEIGIGTINKIWGSMNKMKKELGLEIVQEDMICKHIDNIEQAKLELKSVCNIVFQKENRKIITTKDIKKYGTVNNWAYSKVFKKNNLSLREYIKSIGYELQQEGNGLNYTFENGEKVRSQYELNFSNLLRNKLNLQYNKDYFRDIRYKKFIKDYNGMLDCDYIINYKGRKIYIEIVGMLRDYKDNWKTVELKSNSKTKYIEHLKQKERMFIENNLEYYILFPSDLKDENFLLSIFNR